MFCGNKKFSGAAFEFFPCNYCNGNELKTISKKDRYSLNTKVVICKRCGLIFINPRMDNKSYDLFYKNSYRHLLQKYKNRGTESWNLERNFLFSKELGANLAISFKNYIDSGVTIEVGSSVGGILAGFRSVFPNMDVFGIEPSAEESDFANLSGINTKTSLIENINLDLPRADNIIIVRSLNHLLDPKYFFSWAYGQLKDDGKLIIVVLDFVKFCNRRNKILTQIDHPFMFTTGTLKNFVESSGFEIELFDLVESPDYIKLVAKKVKRDFNIKIDENLYSKTIKELNPFRLYLNYFSDKITQKTWLKS